jgi:hypothetical protein
MIFRIHEEYCTGFSSLMVKAEVTNCVKRGGEGVEEHWGEADDMYHLKIREFQSTVANKEDCINILIS